MAHKKPKYVSDYYRTILAKNVADLSTATFRHERNIPKRLANETGFSKSQIQEILAGTSGASIDLLDRLAKAFDIQVYQLLLPNLDIRNPQVAKGAAPGEIKVYGSPPVRSKPK